MLELYFAPRTRSVRVRWLLEELNLPYQLHEVTFVPTQNQFFSQLTPTGKLPTLRDGEVVICESGAIVQYVLARYGNGQLAPASQHPDFGEYLQWMHFAESTAFPPLGIVIWLTVYRDDAEAHPELVADALERAVRGMAFVEAKLADHAYLLGAEFSAADIMMGFTLLAAREIQVLGDRFPAIDAYLERLAARPALQRTIAPG